MLFFKKEKEIIEGRNIFDNFFKVGMKIKYLGVEMLIIKIDYSFRFISVDQTIKYPTLEADYIDNTGIIRYIIFIESDLQNLINQNNK